MLVIQNLSYRIAGRTLLDQASLTLAAGEHVGLVGRNGCGKSTLLRLVSGQLQPDGGDITTPRNQRVGMIAQHAPDGPDSILDTVLKSDRERLELLADLEHCGDPNRLAELHERLQAIEAHSAPARAARVLAGLGFDAAAQERPVGDLSGGWRMRVALAALLFQAPDLLLLDEPTNHLDLEASLWLEGFLKAYRGTILLVSHDRDLLNRTVSKIAHLEAGKIKLYGGNYDRFEETRRLQLANQSAQAARQEAERKRIQAFVDRFRAKATKARQAQSRIKALARMEPVAAVVGERTATLDFPEPDELAPPLITAEGVAVGYDPAKPVLRELAFRIDAEDRIALLGANGNGKTTFLRLLAKRLAPFSGEITRSGKLKVGYFAQDQADELDLDATPLQVLGRLQPRKTETQLRAQLGRFAFDADHVGTRIGALSGGERSRLLLALNSRDAPHILLLDEPTNHLDIQSRDALIQAVNDYRGAVILVTHDPHLIELCADRLWLVADGGLSVFEGDMADYRRHLLSADGGRNGTGGSGSREAVKRDGQGGGESGSENAGSSKKAQRRARAEERAKAQDLRRNILALERRMNACAKAKAELEKLMADPTIYEKPGSELADFQRRHHEAEAALEAAEEAWLQAQEMAERQQEQAKDPGP